MELKIKPSEINTEDHLWSTFGRYELESEARLLIDAFKKNGDNFPEKFSYEEYAELRRKTTEATKECFMQLVEQDFIKRNDDNTYSLKLKFFSALDKYITK